MTTTDTVRFVRHTGTPSWGLGVIAAEDGSKLDVLFETMGHKKFERGSARLAEVPDGDVPLDHPLRTRETWPRVARDASRNEAARRTLPGRFSGLVEEFKKVYPEGLRSERCDAEERDYKWKAVEYARATLEPDALAALLAKGEHTEILKRTRGVLGKINLVFPNELMKFDGVPVSDHAVVAQRVVDLVSAGDGTPEAVEALAESLRPYDAHKWTLCSLLPFLLEPAKWPFVKPTAIERAVAATGFQVEYTPMPSARTYRLVRDLYTQVFDRLTDLTESGFKPRDAIDVQTFLWVASGMAREAAESRERAAKKTRKKA